MTYATQTARIPLTLDPPIWERVFTAAPLVVIGTREADGSYDLAPKHMAMPLGWGNYFCFVCTPHHRTYHNIREYGEFTVSFPKPDQVVLTSLTAAPRCDDGTKPSLGGLATVPATAIDGVCLEAAYLVLECKCDRILDGFGDNSLIIGHIVAAQAEAASLRLSDRDDADLLQQSPLLVYLSPGRYGRLRESYSFPFHAGFQR